MPDQDREYDWIGDKDGENMAERIDEWNDPIERDPNEFPMWKALLMLLLIWLSGVAVGAFVRGWRPF
jgi:hypothetical protein